MANDDPSRGALAAVMPVPAMVKMSFSDHSSPILASSPSRKWHRRAAVFVVVMDRSRDQAAARSGPLRIQAGASADLANTEGHAALHRSCRAACLIALSLGDTMARDHEEPSPPPRLPI